MLTEKEILFLKELNVKNIPFLIVGMMAAVLQDVPLTTQDIDLWFENTDDPRLNEAAQRCGGVFLPVNLMFQIPPLLGGDDFQNLDVVYGIQGLNSFQDEYENALTIELAGVPVKVLPLERIIASKMATGRKKDKAVLPLLNTVLLDKKSGGKDGA